METVRTHQEPSGNSTVKQQDLVVSDGPGLLDDPARSQSEQLAAERDAWQAEAKRVTAGWAELREYLDKLRAEHAAETRRLGNEHKLLADQLSELRQQLDRVTAERDSWLAEAKRVSNAWTSVANELGACKRRIDIAEGDKLIAESRLRSLEATLRRFNDVQSRLVRQPLYRLMCRTGLLKSLEPPIESSSP